MPSLVMGKFFSTPKTLTPTSPATGEDMYFDYPFKMAKYPHKCYSRASAPGED
jgi:hypothetical protein